jgi:hypothetical protein
MKKVAIIAAAVLVIAVLAITAIGFLLPGTHRASGEIVLAAPAEQVFAAISDVQRYPEWRTGLTRVELLGTAPVRWREHDGSDAITFEVADSQPPQQWRVRIADPDLPFGGTWTYRLSPEGSGTRLRIVEDGEVHNPIFRFVSRFIIGHTATIDRYLEDLQRRIQ